MYSLATEQSNNYSAGKVPHSSLISMFAPSIVPTIKPPFMTNLCSQARDGMSKRKTAVRFQQKQSEWAHPKLLLQCYVMYIP